jgi:uncharacterized membrane protein
MSTLKNDIDTLVQAKVISSEVASKINTYYQSEQDQKPNTLMMVFGVLGSLLVGMGIILIVAHNWDDFTKPVKTIFAFLPMIIGQLLVGFSLFRNKSATWKEGSGVFLFFTVGACLALISQIYNIPGNLSNYLLTWIILCAPLIYLLKSKVVAILHLIFATYYACEFGYFSGGDKTPWLYLLMIAFFIPFYIQKLKRTPKANSTSLLNWFLPLSITIAIGTFITSEDFFGFLMYIVLFGLFYNLGRLPVFYNQKLRRNGLLILGSFGTICVLLFTTFRWFWKEFPQESEFSQTFIITLVLFLVTLGVLGYVLKTQKVKETSLFQYVFLIAAVIFSIGFTTAILPTVLGNILVFALGLTAIRIGTATFNFGVLNYGLLIVTALVISRFFDTDMSFIIRGLLFVGVGIGFFATNYVLVKKQREQSSLN